MGEVRFGVPEELVADLARAQDLAVAVETGTFRGASARSLAGLFDRVITIELSETLHATARESLADLDNVTLLQGASADLLGDVVREIQAPALYWLDGHWCEDAGTAGRESQCPIMEEIATIDAVSEAAGACILIDDAHFFLGPPPPPFRRSDWPTFTQVLDQLRRVHERCVTVLEGVIIAGPPAIQPAIDHYWLGVQFREIRDQRDDYRNQAFHPSAPAAMRGLAKAIALRGRMS